MVMIKKLDRLKQWGKERLGGDVKTDTSDDFKALEVEMQLRQEGMERMKKAADGYIKSLSTREQGENKEKQLPVAYFGATMASHGDDFEPESEFGQCLTALGRANERIARMQETYCANATASWLESLERSLVQMKEYQAARKKLENRRLAYDTQNAKTQKSKKEDYRMEEELRSQKAKYEESSEDVYRRMLDTKEAEVDSVGDLTSLLEAELVYFDRCREVLMQVKRDWPAQAAPTNRSGTASPVNGLLRRNTRSRAGSQTDRFARIAEDEGLEPPSRPTISSRLPSGQNSPRREVPGFDLPARPGSRTSTFESSAQEDYSTVQPRLTRVPTDPNQILNARSQLRVSKRDSQIGDSFASEQGEVSGASSDFGHSRTGSWSTTAQDGGRKAPPPPPPSRAKKPPPPPPLKRSALSTSEVPQY